jgi:hypothetical protein
MLPAFGAVLLICAPLTQAVAQDRETLGIGRAFTNDVLGDRQDRWRSGGYSISAFRGPDWTGELPAQPGQIIEYRLRGDVIAPDNLANPVPGDRLYAGTWWVGAHTHFLWSGFDVSMGGDLVITGEQSGIRSIQTRIHDALSMPRMDVEDHQIDDGIYLHATVEIARDIAFSGGALRPFMELQAGAETMARAGFDLTLGQFGQGGLRMRDPVTGQRIAGISGEDAGWSAVLGADLAFVESSIFLPTDRGYSVEETRSRVRAGVNYGFGRSNLFYGVTYLSEEFVGQPVGQVVGSLSFNLQF